MARFAWSYSKLKNFESCPKRHNEIDLLKRVHEDDSEQLKWGNNVHGAMAQRLAKNVPLPAEMVIFEPWAARVAAGPGKLLVEQKYAITKEFAQTAYFAPSVWYRGVGDVVRIANRAALVVDWKTGKILEDSVQLALMAQCVFAHYPQVQRVRAVFAWLAEGDDVKTDDIFDRNDMADLWLGLLPRVGAMEDAAKTQTYPPKPGRLCRKWCPVVSCLYHGK